MALTISKKDIPSLGDKVSRVEVSEDGECVWVEFHGGKVVIAHIDSDDRNDLAASLEQREKMMEEHRRIFALEKQNQT